MLLQFNFKNFKSFRDDTTLDLSATKFSEYSNRVISVGNEKVLPVAAIFGANAHGKSNVIEAFRFMHAYVIRSFSFGGSDDDKKAEKDSMPPTPFLFDAVSRNKESSFEVYFIDSEEKGAKTYNYGFTVNLDGVNEEWLNYRSKSTRGDFTRIFYRNTKEKELDLSGLPKKSQDNIKVALENESLVVSLGSKLKIAKLKQIRNWFYDNEFADYGEPVESLFLSRRLPQNFVDDMSVQNKVIEYFSAFDKSIKGFEIEKSVDSDGDEAYSINATHLMIDSKEVARIPLAEESAGTLKMFSLFPMLKDVLVNGGIFVIDELNARLHPLLVRTFLLTFLNPEINTKKAQLIFTTHDAWQLESNGLRRDEIWFAEKDADGVSTLYSLADFSDEYGVKIRKDENFEKNYLLGKYGAIPTLKYFDMFKED